MTGPSAGVDARRDPPDGARRELRGGIRGGVLLLLAVAAVALVGLRSDWLSLCWQSASYAESDYELHWAAGRALVSGLDPYDPDVVQALGSATGRPITPFCAAPPLMVRLFTFTGADDVALFERGYRVALAVNVALLAISVLLLAWAIRSAGRWPSPGVSAAAALTVALCVVSINDGTWMALYYNQLNFVTLAAVLGALCAAQRGAERTEGALLALATAAKLSPALLIVVAALAGRWRTVRAAALSGAVLLALSVVWNGWPAHVSWLHMAQRELGYVAPLHAGRFNNSLHEWNLAPNGVLSRAGAAADWPVATTRAAEWAISALVLAALFVAVRRTRAEVATAGAHGDDVSRVAFAQYALGIGATFLVSSVTWVPHLSLAALPAAWLVLSSWSGAARRSPGWLLVGALAVAVLALPLGAFGTPEDQSRDIQLKLAACVLLFAATWVLAGDDSTESAPGQDG